jgi:hypothetical protein
VLQDHLDLRVLKVLLGQLVHKDFKVFEALQVKTVPWGRLVRKATQVLVGPPVQQVQLEILVLLDRLVHKAIQALVGLLDRPGQAEIQVQ